MLLSAPGSLLWLVDIQERLLPAIHDGDAVLESAQWLVGVAGELSVPVFASAQYPKGLGPTVAALRDRLEPDAIVEKVQFACSESPDCMAVIEGRGRRQVVLAGIEAHVCVLQTALGLQQRGHEVFVVADAAGSRRPGDRDLAFARLRQQGVSVVSREMVAFEWLRCAGTDDFRRVSRGYLREI